MDAYEATRVVFSRIQAIDPENAAKIMGFLLIQDHGDKEMIRLAFGPESLLHSLILKAKNELGIFPPQNPLPFSRSNSFHEEMLENEYLLQEQLSFLNEQDMYATSIEQQCQDYMLMRSKSQRFPTSPSFPYSPTSASSSRVAALAMMLENENKRFMARSDFSGIANPSSRQIYLTFPAESTFSEEDVSNYFSLYGPVQDVRIPYQQKRMFGFVTFEFPETVKLILAKGNPHFVCDARVLVKPYKEKGKVPDKYGKLQQGERFDFSGPPTPTGYELQQLANARMMYNGHTQEVILRRKLEEQLAAAELQQAIEMQGRRLMGLQLLDVKNRSFSSNAQSVLSPLATPNSTAFNASSLSDGSKSSIGTNESEILAVEDKSLSPSPGSASIAPVFSKQNAFNSDETIPNTNFDCLESTEQYLPESPFESANKNSSLVVNEETYPSLNNAGKGHLIDPTLLPSSSPLDNMASFKSCNYQMPRFSSTHGAVGL